MILSCEDEDEPPASVSGTGGDGSIVLSHIPMPRLGTLKCAVIILLWQSKGEGNAGGRRGEKGTKESEPLRAVRVNFFFFFSSKAVNKGESSRFLSFFGGGTWRNDLYVRRLGPVKIKHFSLY